MADARGAAMGLLEAALDEPARPAPREEQLPEWTGAYIEPETGLAARIDAAGRGRIRLRYAQHAELLELNEDGSAGPAGLQLRMTEAGLAMDRLDENQRTTLIRLEGTPAPDIAGHYRCGELDAALDVVGAGGALYGAFSGFLGPGRMEQLEPIGLDVWALPCPRALDHTPPGDWTLAFRREGGAVVEVM